MQQLEDIAGIFIYFFFIQLNLSLRLISNILERIYAYGQIHRKFILQSAKVFSNMHSRLFLFILFR